MSAADPGEPPVTRVDITGGKGVQAGDGGIQVNVFQGQPPSVLPAGQVVAGNVPQAPPAFQPREDLLEALRTAGSGVSVVRAVTGMRGVGKTQVAAAYARECIHAGWRLVAWINAEDTAGVLNGLAVVADRLGICQPDVCLETLAQLVRNRPGSGRRAAPDRVSTTSRTSAGSSRTCPPQVSPR